MADPLDWESERWKTIKKEYLQRKQVWSNIRGQLSMEQKEEMDTKLYYNYRLSKYKDYSEFAATLNNLYLQGASTRYFPDSELSTENIGQFLSDVLVGEAEKNVCDIDLLNKMVETVKMLMMMGEEVMTNKRYAGNGGLPGPWFVYNYVVTGDGWRTMGVRWPEEDVWLVMFRLLEYLVIIGGYLPHVWDLHYVNMSEWGEGERRRRSRNLERVFQLLSYHGYEKKILEYYTEIYPHGSNIHKHFLHTEEDIFITFHLWKYFYQALLPSHHEIVVAQICAALKKNLGNPTSRKLLYKLLRSSSCISDWIVKNAPSLLFLLCSMKERYMVGVLIKDRKEVKNLQDKEGNTLLTYVSGCRGRTERIVSMLVKDGWDKEHVNNKGETAMDRAIKIKHWGIVSQLSVQS